MKNKKFLAFAFILIFLSGLFLFSNFSYGQAIGVDPNINGIVPCGRAGGEPCTLCHLVVGIHRLFSYGVFIIVAVSLAVFFIAGAVYIVSFGDQGLMEKAKKTMLYSMSGLVIVACAWLMINVTIYAVTGNYNSDLGIGMSNWWSLNGLNCN